jgi:hypothetical protein
MAELLEKNWTLAEAVADGLAVAAPDPPLTTRIATDADKQWAAVSATTAIGVVIDKDNLHYWVVANTTTIQKRLISDNTLVASFTGNQSAGGTRLFSSPLSLTRGGPGGRYLYFAARPSPDNDLGEIDMDTMVCQMYRQATVTSPACVVSCVAGKAWAKSTVAGSGVFQEFTLTGTGDAATATATGRTVGTAWDMVVDWVNGHLYWTDTDSLFKLRESDLVVLATINSAGSAFTDAPGASQNWRGLAWDQVRGRLILYGSGTTGANNLTFVNAGFTAVEGQFMGYWMFGGHMASYSGAIFRCAFSFSDDGSQFAFMASNPTLLTPNTVRIMRMSERTATWTWTPGVACTLLRLILVGHQANQSGKTPGLATTTSPHVALHQDHVRTKWRYTIGGGAPVDYQGSRINALVPAGEAVTLTAAVTITPYMPGGPRPWIGDETGAGPAAIASFDAGNEVIVEVPGGRSRVRVGGGAARVRAKAA